MSKAKSSSIFDKSLIHSEKAESILFDKKSKTYNCVFSYKYGKQKFKREYSIKASKTGEEKGYEEIIYNKFQADIKNGKVKQQVLSSQTKFVRLPKEEKIQVKKAKKVKDPRDKFKKKFNKKPLIIALSMLLVGGAVGGTLYGLKDIIFNKQEAKTYKVTYNCGDGTLSGEHIKTIDEEPKISVAPNPTRENYVFGGWYSDEALKNKIFFPHTIDKNETMYAKWNRIGTFTISFNTNSDECTIPELTVVKGTTLKQYGGALTNPHRKDHTFIDWYYDEDFTEPVNLDKAIIDSFTLHAKYVKSAFTLKFDTSGGTGPSGSQYDSATDNYFINSVSKLAIEPYSEKLSGSTYLAFHGWKDDAGNLISYPKTIESDTKLTAVFGTEPTYSVSFYKDENSKKMPFKTLDHQYKVKTPPIESEIPNADPNYKLVGWKDSSGNLINFNENPEGYILNSDAALYGVWEQVSFKADFYTVVDGVVSSSPADSTMCAYLNKAPSVSVDDCDLIGWYPTEKCEEGSRIDFSETLYLNEDTKLYGKFERNAFNVTFKEEANENQYIYVSSSQHMTKITKDNVPNVSKKNNKATYYLYDSNEGKLGVEVTQIINENGLELKNYKNFMKDGTLTIILKWVPNAYTLILRYPTYIHKGYDVTIDGQNVVLMSDLKKYEYDPSDDQYKKYICTGWKDENGDLIRSSSITLNHDNTVLTAVYSEKIFNLTINCKDLKGQSLIETPITQSIDYGIHYKKDLIIPAITDDSYVFYKWQDSTGKDLDKSFDVQSDIYLNAIFEKYYDVQFGYILYEESSPSFTPVDSSSLTKLRSVNTDSLISLIPSDIKKGRIATLWGMSGTTMASYSMFSGTRAITSDNILTEGSYIGKCVVAVVLQIAQLDIVFKNGTETVTTLKKTPGQIISNSEIPNTSALIPPEGGNVFNGWKDEDGNYVDFSSNTFSITSPKKITITFTAIWNELSEIKFNIKETDTDKAEFLNADSSNNFVPSNLNQITLKSSKVNELKEGDVVTATDDHKYKINMKKVGTYTYKLSGWDYENGKRATFPVTNNTSKEVYASFVQLSDECSVLFDAGESSFIGTTQKQIILTSSINKKLGDLIKDDPNYKRPADYGEYLFSGWSIFDGNTKTYSPVDDNYELTGNVYLYPVFKEKVNTPSSFTEDNWATLLSVAEKGFDKLQEAYEADFKSSSKTKQPDTFTGLKRTMKINNLDCGVMVIGENHDVIKDGVTAPLTFITTETSIKEVFNPSLYTGKSNQWASSSIRKTMQQGSISGKIEKTVMNHIQTIKKQTRWGQDDCNAASKSYLNNIKNTDDTIFLLSATELGLNDSKYNFNLGTERKEGTKYLYLDGTSSTIRFKYRSSAKSTAWVDYWTRSPYNYKHNWNSGKKYWNGYLGSGINRIEAFGTLYYTNRDPSNPFPETPGKDDLTEAKKSYFADIYRAVIFGFAVGTNETR